MLRRKKKPQRYCGPKRWWREKIDPPSGKFFRSSRMWRDNKLHISRAVETTASYFGPSITEEVAYCKQRIAVERVVSTDAVPDGFEICQRCADRFEFESHRDRQINSPDRSMYNNRTTRRVREAEEAAYS